MFILLDIDGVLVTTPGWRKPELDADGFLRFNERAAKNLSRILEQTGAELILTTTHRVNYTLDKWKEIFWARGIRTTSISFIKETTALGEMPNRAKEIMEWVEQQDQNRKFVVIDDDLSLNGLPKSIKEKCVLTKSLIGLDDEAMAKIFKILHVA